MDKHRGRGGCPHRSGTSARRGTRLAWVAVHRTHTQFPAMPGTPWLWRGGSDHAAFACGFRHTWITIGRMGKSKPARFFFAFWDLYRSAPGRSFGWKCKLLRVIFILWGGLLISLILDHRLEGSVLSWFAVASLTFLLFIADLWLAAKSNASQPRQDQLDQSTHSLPTTGISN